MTDLKKLAEEIRSRALNSDGANPSEYMVPIMGDMLLKWADAIDPPKKKKKVYAYIQPFYVDVEKRVYSGYKIIFDDRADIQETRAPWLDGEVEE